MIKKCDHTSVGMLVWKKEGLLLIERKKIPFGFAPPAGHVDGDNSFEIAAKRELKEEVGLNVGHIELLIEGRKENQCRREDGNWHYWKIYKIEVSGSMKRNKDEVKRVNFYSKSNLRLLAAKTDQYLRGNIEQGEWEKSPGLELVWYEWFKELGVIKA